MATTLSATFQGIKADIANGRLAPVYLLHGDESYYVDQLVKEFDSVIPESDKAFDECIVYAPQVEAEQVAQICRRYPLMAKYQMVIVKELQQKNAAYFSVLAGYASNPNPHTILVLCGRGASIKSKELMTGIKASGGIIYESKKIRDFEVDKVIADLVHENRLNIEQKAIAMLHDYIGTDIATLNNEIAKLAMILGSGAMVTPESIERHVGISKDYNNFELIDAIALKDANKVFRIIEYFKRNPKNNPTTLTITQLFKLFSNLLIVWYSRDKSEAALMAATGEKYPRAIQMLLRATKYYNAFQVIEIISAIRECDAQIKGIGSRQNEYDLLYQLGFLILNASGKIKI